MTSGRTRLDETIRRCPQCEALDSWREKTVEVSHVVSGHEFVGAVPARECAQCGHLVRDAVAEQKLCLQIATIIVEAGFSSGNAFRFLRRAIGMRASEIARLLHVAPETVSRWETERRAVDPSSYALLAAMVREHMEGRRVLLAGLERLTTPGELPRSTRVPPPAPPQPQA